MPQYVQDGVLVLVCKPTKPYLYLPSKYTHTPHYTTHHWTAKTNL